MMITLVKCIEYPEPNFKKTSEDKLTVLSFKDYFPSPVVRNEFRVSASPFEVLKQTLPTHYLREYLGIKPWIIEVSQRRGYLDISETKETKVDGNITELLSEKEFLIAKRPYRLTAQELSDLAEDIIKGLNPDNFFEIYTRNDTAQSSTAYSDLLKALGRNISSKQVNQMLTAKYQRLEMLEREQRLRIARDWSAIAHQVVGGEI